MTTSLRGKCSWFGGPADQGVSPDENLAFIYSVQDQPSLFLSEQPPGTTGLARRLDPETFYVATRWDYSKTSKTELLDLLVEVRNPKTGKSCIARPADWGPHEDTDRVADVSSGLLAFLDLETDEEIEVIYPAQGVQPMTDIPVCIDISHHQGTPDMEEVAASGVKGIIHKVSEGTSYQDPNRAKNCANAIAAGLAVSTYHWLSPGSDPVKQMQYYISLLNPVQGERVVIDYEQDGCKLEQLEEAVAALLSDKRKLRVTVYSGHLLKEQLGSNRNEYLATNTDLWLAQYTSGTPSWSDETYSKWTLWQYSDEGRVPGIDDNYVDLNNYNGTDTEFLTWISPAGAKPPEPSKPPVLVAISAPPGVPVKVTVNNQLVRAKKPGLLQALRKIKRGPDIHE